MCTHAHVYKEIYLCDLDTEYILYGFPVQKVVGELYIPVVPEISTLLENPQNSLHLKKKLKTYVLTNLNKAEPYLTLILGNGFKTTLSVNVTDNQCDIYSSSESVFIHSNIY